MFQNDIEEIKERMDRLDSRLVRIDQNLDEVLAWTRENREISSRRDELEDSLTSICDIFCPDDEYSSINRLHDKIDSLIRDANRKKEVMLAEKTLDKFQDYMKNVDKLNSMINEFKGCVAVARAALGERKQQDSK